MRAERHSAPATEQITISSPATILEMAAISRKVSPLLWSARRELHRNGKTFALRHQGELICVCGLYPIDELGTMESWFDILPAARPHMLRLLRLIRLTLRSSDYRCIVAVCVSDAGKRIARAIGLQFAEHCELGEVWACELYSEEGTTGRPRSQRLKTKKGSAAP